MGKISISDFVEKSITRTGDRADAVMLIAVDGKNVNTSVIGIDEFFVDNNSIALVAAMRVAMERRFKAASIIYENLMRNGKIKSSFCSTVIRDDEQQEDEDNTTGEKDAVEKDEMDEADALVDGLISLMKRVCGGDSVANDD